MSSAKKLILRNAPKIFLDSHESRKQKNDVKNACKIFWRFSQISGAKKKEKRAKFFLNILKNLGSKKMAGKIRAKFFLKILTNITSKKMAGKKRAIIFWRFSPISRRKNGGKNTREKFFIITIMSSAKKWNLRNALKIF